ncbi:MAG TPA: 3-beta hydroxysteroid dehydrogenase, partial [Planctomycetia bacterium]|nr:3-beta hydroxysteroid dehydrogenase [Planctomycetia bacterium]
DLLDKILAAAGLPPIRSRIPLPFALAAGAAAEGVWRLFGRAGEPPLTRFVVKQLATSHWFDLSAARRDLGYEPKVTTEEGLRRLAEHLKRNQAPHA